LNTILLSLAAQAAAPLIRRILSDQIGASNAALVEQVLGEIARHLGVAPAELERVAREEPDRVITAIEATEEKMTPELIALYARGLEGQFGLLRQDARQPIWFSAWRPLWMYFLMALWVWNVVGLHLLNALLKWRLPQMDMTALLSLTGLFMALYMGGHTLKDVSGKIRRGGA